VPGLARASRLARSLGQRAQSTGQQTARRFPRRRVWLPYRLHPAIQPVPDWVLRRDPRERLNQLCDISDWRTGPFTDTLRDLEEPARVHRKAWEYAKLIVGLRALGVLTPDAQGVSVGAGAERTLFYLANHVARIVATDLYQEMADRWGWHQDFLTNPGRYAPFPFRRETLEVRDMSGTDLQFEDGTFDFAYSLSSIEHFGGASAAGRAVREMGRVLRPGGVVCVVTDLELTRRQTGEAFTFSTVEEAIIRDSGLELCEGDVDLRISESLLAHPVEMNFDTDQVSPHIVLSDWDPAATRPGGGSVWTSIVLFFRKRR
jgi:SAM-dependent methyltransferase